jgi:phosphoglucomutase
MADPRAGQPARPEDLVDIADLVTAYYSEHPDVSRPEQQVSFGTSGHRGSAFSVTFNEDHIVATSQAICEYRAQNGIDGPLFLGADTHALSAPATVSALEVFAANDVTVLVDARGGYTPTPSVSRAILTHNASGPAHRADGVVVTPSHNPPSDGGFKYNPPNGGPADTDITKWVQDRANEILGDGLRDVRRVPYARARDEVQKYDFLDAYVGACASEPIRSVARRSSTGPRSGPGTGWT